MSPRGARRAGRPGEGGGQKVHIYDSFFPAGWVEEWHDHTGDTGGVTARSLRDRCDESLAVGTWNCAHFDIGPEAGAYEDRFYTAPGTWTL